MLGDGFDGILAAGGCVPTGSGEVRGDGGLIEADKIYHEFFHTQLLKNNYPE